MNIVNRFIKVCKNDWRWSYMNPRGFTSCQISDFDTATCCENCRKASPNDLREMPDEMSLTSLPTTRQQRFPTEDQANVNNAPDEDEEELNITLQNQVQAVFENALQEQRDGTERSCAHCSKETIVTDVSCLRLGQHISIPGQKLAMSGTSLYRHHAIIKEIISSSDNNAELRLRLIHFNRENGKIKIYETTELYDVHSLRIIEYSHPRYSPNEIVRRAEMTLNECGEGKFDSYNLLTCNCEHFATWCVVGEGESFQVQSLRERIENILTFVFGGSSRIAQFLVRLLFISSDEIASTLTSATATPLGILAGSTAAYCIYCICFTIYLCIQYNRDKTICWPCLKENLVKLWIKFAAYFGTSILTYGVQRFVLPLLSPWIGIPLLVLLLVVSTALIWIISLKKLS